MIHNLSFRYHANMTTKGLEFAKVLPMMSVSTFITAIILYINIDD
jgi:hypothetical protein